MIKNPVTVFQSAIYEAQRSNGNTPLKLIPIKIPEFFISKPLFTAKKSINRVYK
jgi:hypothetical protein